MTAGQREAVQPFVLIVAGRKTRLLTSCAVSRQHSSPTGQVSQHGNRSCQMFTLEKGTRAAAAFVLRLCAAPGFAGPTGFGALHASVLRMLRSDLRRTGQLPIGQSWQHLQECVFWLSKASQVQGAFQVLSTTLLQDHFD